MAKFVTKKDNYLQGLFRTFTDTFSSLDKFTKLFIIIAIIIVVVTPVIVNNKQVFQEHAAGITYDLKAYYPNPNLFKTNYLEGKNYVKPATPTRSVLWFESQDQWSFKQYNYAPTDVNSRCHYDLLSWWDDGFFRYTKTYNGCPGVTPNEIVYESPIILLPRFWNSSVPWSYTGQATAKYYQNGVLKCQGINSYTSQVIGLEQITPTEKGIHWKTTQTTKWTSGNVPGGCYAGYTTHWQEDYWLTDILPVQNGVVAKALKRSKGGNLDIPSDSWDIWFDKWSPLK
jgi:hypothetical protein